MTVYVSGRERGEVWSYLFLVGRIGTARWVLRKKKMLAKPNEREQDLDMSKHRPNYTSSLVMDRAISVAKEVFGVPKICMDWSRPSEVFALMKKTFGNDVWGRKPEKSPEKPPFILYLSGKSGSGKTTAATIFTKWLGFHKLCIASSIWNIAEMLTGVDVYWMEVAMQLAKVATGFRCTMGQLLVTIDQAMRDKFGPLVWIEALWNRTDLNTLGSPAPHNIVHGKTWGRRKHDPFDLLYYMDTPSSLSGELDALEGRRLFVVPDVRTPEEAAFLEARGAIGIRITRTMGPKEKARCLAGRSAVHPLETALDTYAFSHVVSNDANLDKLGESLIAVLKKCAQ